MRRTRQRFLWSVVLLLALQGSLALAVALPLLVDAAVEAAHTLLRLCQHSFRPHYLEPATPIAALVSAAVLAGAVRFAAECRAITKRTRAVTSPLLAAGARAASARVDSVIARRGISRRVDVVDACERLAFCHGLLRPRVCISTGLVALLDQAELAAVLMHEEYHRRRREPLRLTLLAATARVLRFWPGVRPLIREARTEMEVAADAEAVRRGASVQAVARALLKLLQQPGPTTLTSAGLLAVSPLSPTAARIECLTRTSADPYPPLSWRYFVGLLTGLLVPVAGLAVLAAASGLHSVLHPWRLI